jgi:hypothetical protein
MEEFNLFEAPMGWLRSDLIKEKLKSDKIYRSKFTNDEIRQINNIN